VDATAACDFRDKLSATVLATLSPQLLEKSMLGKRVVVKEMFSKELVG
jgi:hypothetical protein